MFAVHRRRVGRHWWGLVFVAPVVAFFAVFNLFPVVFGFAISLTDYDLLDPPNFVGFDNFRNLLDDDLFVTAFWNTVVFVAGATLPVSISKDSPDGATNSVALPPSTSTT